ncbi:MAG: phospho-sugar mutase [Ruminococcaceae bacterium]|nr:phospho-sugar mutase [Oscillospiraceae bacterium]
MTYRENYERWLASDKVDEATKAELRGIADNDGEIEFRFIKGLEFGTGGLRGTMVAGTNAMNVYTVAHATQGLADLINKEGKADRGVAIAHDSRNNSELFAKTAASVLAANGIKVKIFDGVRPTPVLSFAVRELGTIAGINITASHNPKQYNGYKAYWEDGAQLPPDHAKTVSEFIAAADIFDDVKQICFDEGVKSGIIEFIPDSFDEIYIKNVLAEAVNPEVVAKVADDLEIVYTPLHGAGYRLVPEVLRRLGIKHIDTVDEQMVLDGNFPTTDFPNPEYPEVFTLGIKLAEKVHSDLIIATDPDADRVGIMSRDKSGEFKCLTGNQVGALLLDYIITAYEETGMPENPYAVKTIVTSEMCTKICADHNVKLHNVLTGFKFIGEVIKKYETTGHDNYIFGFEESYGYLKGTYARDKDSVVAAMLLCEMAAYYKTKNMTLCDAMDALYERYGYFGEGASNIYMEGLDGIEKMKALMNRLRNNPPAELAGYRIIERRDYLNDTVLDIDTGKVTSTGLPTSNVLYYKTEENDVIVIRPSGTEPKIKLYILVNGDSAEDVSAKIAAYDKVTDTWVE